MYIYIHIYIYIYTYIYTCMTSKESIVRYVVGKAFKYHNYKFECLAFSPGYYPMIKQPTVGYGLQQQVRVT